MLLPLVVSASKEKKTQSQVMFFFSPKYHYLLCNKTEMAGAGDMQGFIIGLCYHGSLKNRASAKRGSNMATVESSTVRVYIYIKFAVSE